MSINNAPLSHLVPSTDYFEIDSKAVGDRFAVWVTRPFSYAEDPERRYPVLYVTDGNLATGMMAPLATFGELDPLNPIEAHLQVNVGYPVSVDTDLLATRNRDLIPPGEPVAEKMAKDMEVYVEQGMFTREVIDAMVAAAKETHADKFLDFLEQELRPEIEDRYRVAPGRSGLFGHSMGGLFTLYVLLRQSPMFDRYGIASPAIQVEDSLIYTMLGDLVEQGATFEDVAVHLICTEAEVAGHWAHSRLLGRHYVQIVDKLYNAAFDGLWITTRILAEETHATGLIPSYLNFLRACYAVRAAGGRDTASGR